MMEAASTSETLVNFYQTTQCYNPEDSHLHTRRCENLKSYLKVLSWHLLERQRKITISIRITSGSAKIGTECLQNTNPGSYYNTKLHCHISLKNQEQDNMKNKLWRTSDYHGRREREKIGGDSGCVIYM
jgi:hypothetical protein